MSCTPGGIWKGDVLVADVEELQILDASKKMMFEDSTRKQFSCQTKETGSCFLPCADGTVGGWQEEVKKSATPIRTRSPPDEGGEHHDDLQGEADGFDPAEQRSADDT